MNKEKIKGWLAKAELTYYKKADITKDNEGTPVILEIWKDGKDMKDCAEGARLVEVEVTIKPKP